jgi:ketosteroid isomerase-like protein
VPGTGQVPADAAASLGERRSGKWTCLEPGTGHVCAGHGRGGRVNENVAAVRSSYERFNADDLEGALSMMDDGIVWHQAQGLPHGGIYQGLAAVRAAIFDPLDEAWWEDFLATPEEIIGCGEHVVVLGRYTGRGKHTGKPLDIPFAHLWRFRDGRAIRFHQFTDTRGWVDALAE